MGGYWKTLGEHHVGNIIGNLCKHTGREDGVKTMEPGSVMNFIRDFIFIFFILKFAYITNV